MSRPFHEEPYLPRELERTIFILASRADLSVAQNLLLVARRTFDWVIAESTKLERYGKHVRHLLVAKHDVASTFMELCPNVVNLAIWTGTPYTNKEITAVLDLKLTSLSIDLDGLYRCPPGKASKFHTLFSCITHLDVSTVFPWNPHEVLIYFTALTHLAIPEERTYQVLEDCLACCKTVKVLVWLCECPHKLRPAGDLRVVSVQCGRSYIMDWEDGARGREDMWSIAEAVATDRLRVQGAKLAVEE
ncbi:hypothetical protein BDN72DRAFT_901608 [Pluteus cervinus]|uniref:Uncharacterized protein n=1 Tax=Pluteus cervinus TaxID=181527 RepID=A0ACD3AF86_9AGAR|nr:hypothetical protein BDN72DRAFT_901608 [Pluteus cervinus]